MEVEPEDVDSGSSGETEDVFEDASSTVADEVPVSQGVLYNHRIMDFLQTQLHRAQVVQAPQNATSESVACFDLQIATGQRLLARHADEANLLEFYTTEHAHKGVMKICESLCKVIHTWNLPQTVNIEMEIPENDVKADKQLLQKLLRYVYLGDCVDVDDTLRQEWHALKAEHGRRMAALAVVVNDEVRLGASIGEGGWGVVHEGEWSGQKVAVKKPKEKAEVPIEELASLINEAVIQASVQHDHIVSLHAMTTNGWLVMELATKDLRNLCKDEKMIWSTKVGLMLQAAKGVHHMHTHDPPLVHSDLKPQNILVFNSTSSGFCAKVSDFGQTFELIGSRSKTIRPAGGTLLWIAPESHEGKPLTPESDVFSLGLVMYNVVTGKEPYELPYGSHPEAVIMYKKCSGTEEPCPVKDGDCPQQMLHLMRECCDRDPGQRPKMAEVVHRLQRLPKDWQLQVEFSSKAAAAIFRDKMGAMNAKRNGLVLYQHQPQVAVLNEGSTADAQASSLVIKIQQTIKAITEVSRVAYCREMVSFLQVKIGKLAAQHFTMPAHAAKNKWRHDAAVLLHELKAALQLVRWHSSLHIDVLYRSVDTKAGVEQAFRAVKSYLSHWSLPGASDFPDVLPAEYALRDKENLDQCLQYVFEGKSCDFGGERGIVKTQWEMVKASVEERMLLLPIVPDKRTWWGKKISANVHEVMWHGITLAGKQIIPYRGGELDLEDFQKFQADVYDMISDAQYIVKVQGVTRAGGILMDLAKSDLRQWYLNLVVTNTGDRIAVKLRVLAQAARALHSVHALGKIHGRVKSSNFLLFGDEIQNPVVKIADLPLPAEHWHKDCPPPTTAGKWMAKEVYEGQVPSSKSDVFSFGCLMYELVMEKLPYGDFTSEAEIMKSKLAGKLPFDVPKASKERWPVEVLELMTKCCSPHPDERPTMHDVDICLQKWCPKQPDWQMMQPKRDDSEVAPIWKHLPWSRKEQVARKEPLYNQRSMNFLADQLDKALALGVPVGARPEEVANHKRRLIQGKRLLAKHADHFDIRDFYSTEHVRYAVETICTCLKEVMFRLWGMSGAYHIEEVPPEEIVQQDRQVLHSLLNYLLRDVQFDASGVLAKQLDAIKMRHKENMKLVRFVDEDMLQLGELLGEGGQSRVYKALWMSTQVAVKKPSVHTVWSDMDVEQSADFLREVVMHAALNDNPHIVQLLAATPSGWIVLELADSDLHKLCHTTRGMRWATKIRLLREAAAGLALMHSQKRVHGDVKPQNFLIFGTNPESCHLKIGDLSHSFEARQSRSKTVRMGGGTPAWQAPELYEGKPINSVSDVYSFGVVCHEVVTQMQPFGWDTTNEFAIMAKKFKGEAPCHVVPNSCPSEMLTLMSRCCALKPAERPTMEDVHSMLLQLPEDWEPTGTPEAAETAEKAELAGTMKTMEDVHSMLLQLPEDWEPTGTPEVAETAEKAELAGTVETAETVETAKNAEIAKTPGKAQKAEMAETAEETEMAKRAEMEEMYEMGKTPEKAGSLAGN